MVKIDLITGFLGSGKTTFLKKYEKLLIEQGQNIGILENDFGAVNVDMMLLQELEGEHCHHWRCPAGSGRGIPIGYCGARRTLGKRLCRNERQYRCHDHGAFFPAGAV